MTDSEEKLRESLKRFIKQPEQSKVCKVIAIDEDTELIDVEPLDGQPELYYVRLNAMVDEKKLGVTIMPALNSFVIITLIDNNINNAFVSLSTEFEWVRIKKSESVWFVMDKEGNVKLNGAQIQLNGDSLGGLVVSGKVAERFNRLEDALEKHILEYNSHTHLAAGTATAVPGTLSAIVIVPKTTEDYISNPSIKQG